jgi:hypothetical protein
MVDGLRNERGVRIRKFFKSRDEANEWLRKWRPEIQSHGRAAIGLADSQRVDALRALAILAPYEVSLTDAAHAFAERAKLLSRSVTFTVLRQEFVAAKEADRKSVRYVGDIRTRLLRFGHAFDDRYMSTIEARDIDDWLRALKLSPTSRVNFRKVLHSAFEFAVLRGYASENPVAKTARVKAGSPNFGTLRPHEIGAMLASV